jgi:hypothetical protein
LSAQDRCLICLKKGHAKNKCFSGLSCTTCEGDHNKIICIKRAVANKDSLKRRALSLIGGEVQEMSSGKNNEVASWGNIISVYGRKRDERTKEIASQLDIPIANSIENCEGKSQRLKLKCKVDSIAGDELAISVGSNKEASEENFDKLRTTPAYPIEKGEGNPEMLTAEFRSKIYEVMPKRVEEVALSGEKDRLKIPEKEPTQTELKPEYMLNRSTKYIPIYKMLGVKKLFETKRENKYLNICE